MQAPALMSAGSYHERAAVLTVQVLVQDHVTEGHDIPSFPGERLPSFSDEPDVPFGTPNLEHHGIGKPLYPD